MSALADLDVNLLVPLRAALEERNLTRAGERVGMTQPAMSGALARLRTLLGDELLVRSGRGYVLSPLAEELLPAVQEALVAVEETLDASRRFDPATSTRQFVISISDYALTVLTEPLARLLAERAPRVDMDFEPLPPRSSDVVTHLLRRDLVIAGAGLGMPGLRRTIFADHFVCIASAENPAGRSGPLDLDELRRLPYARGTFGDGTPTPVDLALADAEVAPRVAVTVHGLLALPFVVSGTDLLAFVPERLALQSADTLGLRVVATALRIDPLVETAHWHPVHTDEAGLRWLLGLLREVSHQLHRARPEAGGAVR